jgi:flagella basal body P-ring formation protein FlgA
VQPGDVTWDYRDTSYSFEGIPAQDEIAGKRVRRGLRAGDVIWASALEKEKAVRRGESVQVHVGEGAFEVTLNAVAQQDAFIGDVVSLKNSKTNRLLTGEVVGQGEVELK